MKKKSNVLGVFKLGLRKVTVMVEEKGTGGSFFVDTDEGSVMTIGLGYSDWRSVLSVLMHEAIELASVDLNIRYRPDIDFAQASDGYFFIMDHNGFSEMVARAAWFCSQVIPELADRSNSLLKKRK